MKKTIAVTVSVTLSSLIIAGSILLVGCKSTIKIPEGLTTKCQLTYALIIAYHESKKNDETKGATALLLQESQKACLDSIDKERIRTVSLACKKEVYGEQPADFSDLSKKEVFLNCIRIKEGEIK